MPRKSTKCGRGRFGLAKTSQKAPNGVAGRRMNSGSTPPARPACETVVPFLVRLSRWRWADSCAIRYRRRAVSALCAGSVGGRRGGTRRRGRLPRSRTCRPRLVQGHRDLVPAGCAHAKRGQAVSMTVRTRRTPRETSRAGHTAKSAGRLAVPSFPITAAPSRPPRSGKTRSEPPIRLVGPAGRRLQPEFMASRALCCRAASVVSSGPAQRRPY
jgi:hypothetical protein